MKNMEKASDIMGILLSRAFCRRQKGYKKPKVESKEYLEFYKKILNSIENGQKISIVLGYGYHKNINVCGSAEPDGAEMLSLSFLAELARKIAGVYSVGVMITLVTTGARAEFANGSEHDDVVKYHHAMEKLIANSEEFAKIFRIVALDDIWQEFPQFHSVLNKIIKIIKTEEIDRKKALIKRAKRNTNGLISDEEAAQSVIRFQASFRAEKKLAVWSNFFPTSIFCSYRNHLFGNYILIYTLKKGVITQPWEGYYQNGKIRTKIWFVRTLLI